MVEHRYLTILVKIQEPGRLAIQVHVYSFVRYSFSSNNQTHSLSGKDHVIDSQLFKEVSSRVPVQRGRMGWSTHVVAGLGYEKAAPCTPR